MKIRRFLGNIFRYLSQIAVHRVVNNCHDLSRMWQVSIRHFPTFKNHFSIVVDDAETEVRIRFLVAAECVYIEKEILSTLENCSKCSYADIGDSDGSVRAVVEEIFGRDRLETIGINLQEAAVDRIRAIGLDAICADAIEVGNMGTRYNIVSLFETLEHLPDPIGFLKKINAVVEDRLILSVPYVRSSRVGLHYLEKTWTRGLPVTIETVHIFELSPEDWRKIFKHSGWRIQREAIYKQFPNSGPLNWLLSLYWRFTSFEGFYFVTLVKDTTHSSRYRIS